MTNNTAVQETNEQWAKHIELGVSMNKIDLIIYALELARNEIHDPTLWTDKVDKALAAARELKALKPVVWQHDKGRNIPLYALDGEQA